MAQIKVSVIIPAYNGERYIRECVESLTRQTLKEIEIICVDDGSTDRTPEIIKEMTAADSRVMLLCQQNLHAGVARNNGLAGSSGEYVVFLDADDFFEPEMLEKLYNKAREQQADMVLFTARKYDDVTGEYTEVAHYLRSDYYAGTVFSAKDIPDRILTVTTPAPWTKFFRRSYIDSLGIQFQNLSNTNDLFFTLTALALAERIAIVNEPLVNYRVNTKVSTQDKKAREPLCFLTALSALRDELKSRGRMELIERSYVQLALSVSCYSLRTSKTDESHRQIIKALYDSGDFISELMGHEDKFYNNIKDRDYMRKELELYRVSGNPLLKLWYKVIWKLRPEKQA